MFSKTVPLPALSIFFLSMCISVLCVGAEVNPVRPPPTVSKTALSRADVLSLKDGQFQLDNQPFAEISFNKFDLFWEVWEAAEKGQPLDSTNPRIALQETALRNLRKLGFRTIRFFGAQWSSGVRETFADPVKRKAHYAAMDKTLDMCDAAGIRVVYSLGAGGFTEAKLSKEGRWEMPEEHPREIIANPNSRNRKLLNEYIDETVSRYRGRKTVLMWEITNELLNKADLGDNYAWVNLRLNMPTLKEVAAFYADVTRRIKSNDPLRLVNSGGGTLREHQWNLFQRKGWKLDSFDEHKKAYAVVYADSPVDVIDLHYYAAQDGGYHIKGNDGSDFALDPAAYSAIARAVGKPLMFGECCIGTQQNDGSPRSQKFRDKHPDLFVHYTDSELVKRWVKKALDDILASDVSLVYWWAYQSDKPKHLKDAELNYLSLERTPELMSLFVDANKRLQAKLRRLDKKK